MTNRIHHANALSRLLTSLLELDQYTTYDFFADGVYEALVDKFSYDFLDFESLVRLQKALNILMQATTRKQHCYLEIVTTLEVAQTLLEKGHSEQTILALYRDLLEIFGDDCLFDLITTVQENLACPHEPMTWEQFSNEVSDLPFSTDFIGSEHFEQFKRLANENPALIAPAFSFLIEVLDYPTDDYEVNSYETYSESTLCLFFFEVATRLTKGEVN